MAISAYLGLPEVAQMVVRGHVATCAYEGGPTNFAAPSTITLDRITHVSLVTTRNRRRTFASPRLYAPEDQAATRRNDSEAHIQQENVLPYAAHISEPTKTCGSLVGDKKSAKGPRNTTRRCDERALIRRSKSCGAHPENLRASARRVTSTQASRRAYASPPPRADLVTTRHPRPAKECLRLLAHPASPPPPPPPHTHTHTTRLIHPPRFGPAKIPPYTRTEPPSAFVNTGAAMGLATSMIWGREAHHNRLSRRGGEGFPSHPFAAQFVPDRDHDPLVCKHASNVFHSALPHPGPAGFSSFLPFSYGQELYIPRVRAAGMVAGSQPRPEKFMRGVVHDCAYQTSLATRRAVTSAKASRVSASRYAPETVPAGTPRYRASRRTGAILTRARLPVMSLPVRISSTRANWMTSMHPPWTRRRRLLALRGIARGCANYAGSHLRAFRELGFGAIAPRDVRSELPGASLALLSFPCSCLWQTLQALELENSGARNAQRTRGASLYLYSYRSRKMLRISHLGAFVLVPAA
ncbi:hypothetical protein DFH09DRAFT_1410051 [Mycena vulgaris]|nr:hypothetical protein DFH09DRAFT_1410051 [Mycena vulgaris]